MSARRTARLDCAILSWPWLLPIARIALASAYLIGGIQKLVDFPGAVAEQAHFGLQPAWLWAAAAIIVELGGSALVIVGRWVWLGAGGLGRANRGRDARGERFLGEDRYMIAS